MSVSMVIGGGDEYVLMAWVGVAVGVGVEVGSTGVAVGVGVRVGAGVGGTGVAAGVGVRVGVGVGGTGVAVGAACAVASSRAFALTSKAASSACFSSILASTVASMSGVGCGVPPHATITKTNTAASSGSDMDFRCIFLPLVVPNPPWDS